MKPSNTSCSPRPKWLVVLSSSLFFLGQVISALIVWVLILTVMLASFETRYRIAQLWVRFNLWSVQALCGLRYEVQGLENIPSRNGVILCKHQSAWETLALQTIFPPVVFLLKQELLKIPFWGWAMSALDPIAIDRSAKSAALKKVLRDGEARLQQGRWVVIFPEGTRVAPGQRGHYNASGAMLAQRTGCPVVPVAHNAGMFWGPKAFLKYPGTVQVRIGPPIAGGALSTQEISRLAEEWIEAQMTELSAAPLHQ